MPSRPLHPCNQPGCGALTRRRYCDAHERARQQRADRDRPSAALRGYGRRWQQARLGYLRAHPLCVDCRARGQTVAATVVDHIRPHRGNGALFWDSSNWQPLCARCHDRKTAGEAWHSQR